MHSPKSSTKPRELEGHQTKTFFSFRLLELLGNWIFCKGTGFTPPFTVSFFFFFPWSLQQWNEWIISWGSCCVTSNTLFFELIKISASRRRKWQVAQCSRGSGGSRDFMFVFLACARYVHLFSFSFLQAPPAPCSSSKIDEVNLRHEASRECPGKERNRKQ